MRVPAWLARLPWAALRAGRGGSGRASGALALWTLWERLMFSAYRVRPARPGALLLFRVKRHRGPLVVLADGTRVERGARIVDLHLANRRLLAMRGEPGYGPWHAVRAMRGDLAALGERVRSGDLGDVAALHGLSLVGSAGGILGFETRPRRGGPRGAIERYFMAGIDAVYHPDGLRRLDGRAQQRRPVEVWMGARRAAELKESERTRAGAAPKARFRR